MASYTIYPDLAGYAASLTDLDGESWANLRSLSGDAVSTSAGSNAGPNSGMIIEAAEGDGASTFGWEDIYRGFMRFDTSVIAEFSVTEATVTIKLSSVDQEFNLEFGLYVYSPGVALPTTVVDPNDAFWLDLRSNSSELASDTTFFTDNVSVDQVLSFPLNAAGIAHIDLGGTTVFSLFLVKDYNNTDPISSENQFLSGAASYTISGNPADRPALLVETLDSEADPATSTISSGGINKIQVRGSTVDITVQLKDSEGANIEIGGDTVELTTTLGTLDPVEDNGNGTYSSVLTSGATPGTAEICGILNTVPMANCIEVEIIGADPAESLITATPATIQSGTDDTSAVTVTLLDEELNQMLTGGDVVILSATAGTLSAVTDNEDGTYSAVLTAPVAGADATIVISGTVNGEAIIDTATVQSNVWEERANPPSTTWTEE
jgi:hypothetical protein